MHFRSFVFVFPIFVWNFFGVESFPAGVWQNQDWTSLMLIYTFDTRILSSKMEKNKILDTS